MAAEIRISINSQAQGAAVAIPENARAQSYGSGWACNRGYREDKGRCVAIRLPANAYATETMKDPRYPLSLSLRVITVSLETTKLVASLPLLDIARS